MLPVIALIGRPNVGKSTLFNRLTRSRDAIVADYAGLTRDRQYGFGKLGQIPYIVIDTGGVAGELEDGRAHPWFVVGDNEREVVDNLSSGVSLSVVAVIVSHDPGTGEFGS